MIKKYSFYICLIIIYLLFLSRDTLFKLAYTKSDINTFYCESKNKYIEEEYKELTKLLDINPNDYNIVYSKLINRNIYEFFNKITISKGSDAGIKKGDIVVTNEGVIGVINKLYKHYSEVYLLTNKNIKLSVKINDSYGILTSKDNKLIVKNIKLNKKIKSGDKVYTSGLTNHVGGLYIGKVVSVNPDKLGLEYILEIEGVNTNNIKYLGVITS